MVLSFDQVPIKPLCFSFLFHGWSGRPFLLDKQCLFSPQCNPIPIPSFYLQIMVDPRCTFERSGHYWLLFIGVETVCQNNNVKCTHAYEHMSLLYTDLLDYHFSCHCCWVDAHSYLEYLQCAFLHLPHHISQYLPPQTKYADVKTRSWSLKYLNVISL